ncbi:MAG TPA: CYTH domain-containing protein [Bacteroidia bacterium]|nr:CYTH domain-containing protein [Bacteroidia bacterium]
MGVEIERKFLVDKEKWTAVEKSAPNRMRQGYLLTDPHKTIRVRVAETGGYLTIKGLSTGATRAEFEYEIPKQEAEELLNLFSVSKLDKIRYEIVFNGKVWEVDEFLGENEGLIVAEIELVSESEEFQLPAWVTREVTDEEKYYNSSLSARPFKRW